MGKNFKIRINAAMALAVISKRAHYGEHFCNVSRTRGRGSKESEGDGGSKKTCIP
jgi:hypothetical protein